MKIRSELRAKLILFGSLALGTIPAAVQAEHAWANYHWERATNPLSLTLGANLSETWDPFLIGASADWDASSVLTLGVVAGEANVKNCRPQGGKVEVCSDAYGNNGWLGLAQIWVSGEHITKAAVKVNDTYYATGTTYDTVAWRNLVMCQEVGHVFGLTHQDEIFTNPNAGSCMDYTNDPSTNQHPNQHDYYQLEAIYAHLDTADEGGGGRPPWARGGARTPTMPPAMDVLELDGPGQWGEVIAGSRERGASTYMLDFGGGFAVITFVTWIPE